MEKLNRRFRGVDRTTDVLSFEAGLPVDKHPVLGDVVINVQMAAARTEDSGCDIYDEVNRLLVHGILHLLGYDHEDSPYRAGQMRRKEREIIDALKKMD